MTTATGKAHCVSRLTSCPDLTALRRVWESLAVAYQREPELVALKERIKADMGAAT